MPKIDHKRISEFVLIPKYRYIHPQRQYLLQQQTKFYNIGPCSRSEDSPILILSSFCPTFLPQVEIPENDEKECQSVGFRHVIVGCRQCDQIKIAKFL